MYRSLKADSLPILFLITLSKEKGVSSELLTRLKDFLLFLLFWGDEAKETFLILAVFRIQRKIIGHQPAT